MQVIFLCKVQHYEHYDENQLPFPTEFTEIFFRFEILRSVKDISWSELIPLNRRYFDST